MTRLQYKYKQSTEEIFVRAKNWILDGLFNNRESFKYKTELFHDLLEHGKIQIGEDFDCVHKSPTGESYQVKKRK